ncbi:MAG: corrinoid protein [Candidatus Aminicenantes bacterium]|nr:corrinoid protein [Candidatus Aminicenantes bacterium]
MSSPQIFDAMTAAVIEGNKSEAEQLARQALAQGVGPNDALERGFIPGIRRVGQLWEQGEYFLPELVTSAECMKAVLAVLKPELDKARQKSVLSGKVVIGTVEGDIHDIGKNLVAAMFAANGFEVFDLGADVKLQTFIDKALAVKADFVCLSALLTTTMLNQRRFMGLVKEQSLAGRFKILVGGAPVTKKWAEDIGAHGYAENAMAAVQLALSLSAGAEEPS